ncbi:hypothetical protein EDD11_010602 [Mortierella claussenii]|nr:hypothetical protein EDD11_010602 [Mortierella claussenii]
MPQILPRVKDEAAIEDTINRVAFQTPSQPCPPPSAGTVAVSQPARGLTTTATAAPVAITTTIPSDELYDHCDDSDTEAPLGWTGVTKETIQEGQVIKAGYLMKKGERLKIWKKKWFVLRTSKLAYYKDSKEYELLRIIDIRDIHKAAAVPVKHKPGLFVILTPRRTFSVLAKDVVEMQEWINAINEAKIQFEFTASSSDLESYAGSTVHLEQQRQLQEGQTPVTAADRLQQQQLQGTAAAPARQSIHGMILPRRQQQTPLSLSDPDLLEKREQSRIKRKSISPSSPVSPIDLQTAVGPPTSVSSILDRPIIHTGGLYATDGLSLITSGAQAMQISSPSSPRMEQVHSSELPVGSLSSEQSFGAIATIPGTPSSPGGYYSGGEMFWTNQDLIGSSGEEEDAGQDPCIVEAGRLASEANAPGSGIVTNEQLESNVVRQGHLYKLSKKYKTWRKKWFVLRGDKLTYYKNTKEYQPHGIIPLTTIIDCLQTDPVSKSKQYCLRIVTAKRSFVCCASDEDTLLRWIDALHVECDRVAQEARQEATAEDQRYHCRQGSEALQEGSDGDDEDQTKPLGRRAKLKMNLHSSLPRSRSRSKSGDGAGLFGSSTNSTSTQIRKVLSLDSSNTPASSSTAPVGINTLGGSAADKRVSIVGSSSGVGGGSGGTTAPNVTFQIPVIMPQQHSLPVPAPTVTFSA